MSSRLGNEIQEAVEEVQAVVRARAGLGVVLDRRGRDVEQPKSLDGPVIEVDVRQLGGTDRGLPAHGLVAVDRACAVGPERGETVILGGDLDLPGRRSRTGWLAPRWPNGSLNVSRPTARHSS